MNGISNTSLNFLYKGFSYRWLHITYLESTEGDFVVYEEMILTQM